MPTDSNAPHDELRRAARQQQFLDVISPEAATERFHRHLNLKPLGTETVSLAASLNRILADDVVAAVDVSGFDRSNVDGFAVHAADTFGAMEEDRQSIALNREVLSPGIEPRESVQQGTATTIATGGMVPRGADAVVMVEDTELMDNADDTTPRLEISRAVSPGANITFAGTDVAKGETVLRRGQLLTSREIGVLAAIGMADAEVFRRPRVAIVSTGNEIVPPGEDRPPGYVYDSNAAILSAAVEELGAEPVSLGVVADDVDRLKEVIDKALACDVVVLSGGTSKGAGDLSYQVISGRLKDPGIVAHGVSLKPGKPVCLAVSAGKPVIILPGFPTSAVFTFHQFVAPVIRRLGGRRLESQQTVSARLPLRINSQRGRTEYLLVGLVRNDEGLVAYPMGKGSGSVTTFSCADGFITIGQHVEIVDAGSEVTVQLLGGQLEPADLVVIGSHCVGLDLLVSELGQRGFTAKTMHVGSTGGLAAAKRGECDFAGMHLMDADSGEYNRPFLTEDLELIPGYRRMQSIVFRTNDPRFAGRTVDESLAAATADCDCVMINRNAGSGTRIVIDRLLENRRPAGYAVQAKSHNAVATAIAQGRADWGIAIDTVAAMYDLESIPVQEEHYDFVVPKNRADRPAVIALRDVLADSEFQQRLTDLGFRL